MNTCPNAYVFYGVNVHIYIYDNESDMCECLFMHRFEASSAASRGKENSEGI